MWNYRFGQLSIMMIDRSILFSILLRSCLAKRLSKMTALKERFETAKDSDTTDLQKRQTIR